MSTNRAAKAALVSWVPYTFMPDRWPLRLTASNHHSTRPAPLGTALRPWMGAGLGLHAVCVLLWATGAHAAPPGHSKPVASPPAERLALQWSHSLSTLPRAAQANQPAGLAPARMSISGAAAPALTSTASITDTVGPLAAAATPWSQLLAWADERAASSRAADASVTAAEAQTKQAWAAAWMPRVDASASAFQQSQTVNGLDVKVPTSTYTLSATLPLWRAAERASVQTQEATADQARWRARSNRATVARELSLAYVSAADNAEQQRLAQAQMQLLLDQLAINERRLQGGVGTVLDVLETRTRVDLARATLQDINTRLASQRLVIERLVVQPVVLPKGLLADRLDIAQAVPPQVEALSLAMQRNPQLQDAQAQITAAHAALKGRRAEAWQPTVDAVAQATRSREVQRFQGLSEEQNTTTKTLGLQLNWALFSGGAQQGRTQEGAALLSQAMAQHDDVQGQIESSLRDAYQTLGQARATVEVQRQVETSALATLDAVRKAFLAGLRDNQDLLNAQQQIYSARQGLTTARVAAITAQINILALLDQLDATGVAPLVSMFDTAPLQERTAP